MQPLTQACSPTPRRSPLLGSRYALLNEVGRGAVGVVHRAIDRLTGDTVTIKLIHKPGDAESASSIPHGHLVSLAHEFAILASLRHPNVIRVFDYGFDSVSGPYLVMEHRPDMGTLRRAGLEVPRAQKLRLVIDLLRALAYLHRRGIIHRDVKPENVLVDGDRAKIADFGLSIAMSDVPVDLAGTALYFAPELLRGDAPSPQSDLWAVGIILVELLAGRHPFEGLNVLINVLARDPDLRELEELVPCVERFLAKNPRERWTSAVEAAERLASALPDKMSIETSETRESFLQAARFVGRGGELDRLVEALGLLAQGGGKVVLLAGESGVGKSRLADEAAIRAMVNGIRVLRGQAIAEAASPYDVWRPAMRGIALTADPSDSEAAVLRAIVPDIDLVLGRDVGLPPPIEEAAIQARLLHTVEVIIGKERTPTLVILEDLQWAGSESMRLLTRLASAVKHAPIMILGTYRDDEAPGIPDIVGDATVLKVSRLRREAVGELALAIIGPSAADDVLVDRLVSETEGNPFFLVEILRAISAEVGRLDALGADHIRPRIPAEGVRRIVERRLSRLPPATRDLLRLAAVAGRRLDVPVLERAWGRDIEGHLATAADLAIIEARGETLEFAHDKLREALLDEVEAEGRGEHHRRIAMAIEAVHGESPDQLTALAHHWESASDEAKSLYYAERAGVRTLEGGAFPEALVLLERARAYALRRPPSEQRDLLWRIDMQIMMAQYQQGDLARAREFGELALAHVGDPMPADPRSKMVCVAREIATRVRQTYLPSRVTRSSPFNLAQYAYVSVVVAEGCIFAMDPASFAIATLRLANRAAPGGASGPLSRGWLAIGILATTTPFKGLAARWVERGVTMSRRHGEENDRAYVISRAGVLSLTETRWDEAEAYFREALAATNQSDRRLQDECGALFAFADFFRGRYDRSLPMYRQTLESATRNRTHQVARWSALGCADIAVRRGDFAAAKAGYDREIARPKIMATEVVWGHGMRALARLRSGDREGARADALVVLKILDRSPPVAYWTQHGVHAAATVLLALSPPNKLTAEAWRGVFHATVMGVVARLGRPAAALLQGELLRRLGRKRLARRVLRAGHRLATDAAMPYEIALFDLALAVDAPPAERLELVRSARARLHAIGADPAAEEAAALG